MKRFCSIIRYFMIFIFALDNVCATDEDLWRLGFEIEFPFLGVTHLDSSSRSAFSKEAILEGEHWALIRDTLDSQVEKAVARDESVGIWNLEFKTKANGIKLSDKSLLERSIVEIKEVIRIITTKGRKETQVFGTKTFMVSTVNIDEFIEIARIPETQRGKEVKFVFKPLLGKADEASIMAAAQQVLPQLTFQLPLSSVRRLFGHLYILGSSPIVEFFKSSHPKKFIPDPELDGFSLLFDYYMYRFFSTHDRREPGPKGSFPLMSRVNFRDMYTRLSEGQQQLFQLEVAQRYERFEMCDVASKDIEQTIKDLRYSLDRYNNIKKEKEACKQKLTEFKEGFGDLDIRTQTLQGLASTLSALDGFAAHATNAQSKIEELEALLPEVKMKDFNTHLISRYSRNIFAPTGNGDLVQEKVRYSVREVLGSIVNPELLMAVMIEGDKGDLERISKLTDVFSVPLPGLDKKYSMGVLGYPSGVSVPISVLEVRAYPKILGDLTLDKVWLFIEAELSYCLAIQSGDSNADKRNVNNLSPLSAIINKSIDKCNQREQEVASGSVWGVVK